MSNLLQMPHRCAEAMWTEQELRREMVKLPLGKHVAAWALIVALAGGGMWSALRLLGWAIRMASRFP